MKASSVFKLLLFTNPLPKDTHDLLIVKLSDTFVSNLISIDGEFSSYVPSALEYALVGGRVVSLPEI